MKKHVKFLLLSMSLLICKVSYSEIIQFQRLYSVGDTWVVHLNDFFDTQELIVLWKEIPGQPPMSIATLSDIQVYMQGGLSVDDAGTYVFEGLNYKGEKTYLVITLTLMNNHAQLNADAAYLQCCMGKSFMLKPREDLLC